MGLTAALILIWCTGLFGRGYWTPDEPREADIAWRMSWQADKSVPLLAGEAFCEKPPFTYWLAAVPVAALGNQAWAARLPNLLYALITAMSVGALAARCAGRYAGISAAAAVATFLLSYQVAIWLATDAPLLAAVSLALLGLYLGFYASTSRAKLTGYLLMHSACAVAFLCKSAAGWMVPVLAFGALIVWEKRWRELLRWELYGGLLIQLALIGAWVWRVYVGPDGAAHLKVFFWNNLVGRFARVDAPSELQYAAAHRNTPGKYVWELPLYLFPWTFLVLAALRKAWLERHGPAPELRLVRFGLAAFVPAIAILSIAATARNIYLAPALPGIALLLAWWLRGLLTAADPWDVRALRATAALLMGSALVLLAALGLVGRDAWDAISSHFAFIAVSGIGLGMSLYLGARAWSNAGTDRSRTAQALFLAYCALLAGPVWQLYTPVDTWQDLSIISRDIQRDAKAGPLLLLAPDETTRAMIDMYVRPTVERIDGPINAEALQKAKQFIAHSPGSLVLVQVPGRATHVSDILRGEIPRPMEEALPWLTDAHLKMAGSYSLPHGRRYALLSDE